MHIRVPFSLSDLSQISHKLDSFPTEPYNYMKELQFVINCYDIHDKDPRIILLSALSPQGKNSPVGSGPS